MRSDSTSATTPRRTGSRSSRCRRRTETSGKLVISISPVAASPGSRLRPEATCSGLGLRTATAHVDTPRIITPSRTAWPPMGASRCATSAASARSPTGLVRSGAGLALGCAPLEALDAATRIDDPLLAGVERMAVRADLDVDLGLGRARRELVATRTAHVGHDVLGMDAGLHGPSSLAVSCEPQSRLDGQTGPTTDPASEDSSTALPSSIVSCTGRPGAQAGPDSSTVVAAPGASPPTVVLDAGAAPTVRATANGPAALRPVLRTATRYVAAPSAAGTICTRPPTRSGRWSGCLQLRVVRRISATVPSEAYHRKRTTARYSPGAVSPWTSFA